MAEKSEANKPKQDTEAENEDATVIKELLSVASHERKNLQLLVEYFEKKIPELDERKQFFDRVSSQVPASLQKLDYVSQQIEEIKTFDVRVRDFQRVVKDIESNHSTRKLISDGGMKCPTPWRGRNAIRVPFSSPITTSSEGGPNGVSTETFSMTFNSFIEYKPLPPITPSNFSTINTPSNQSKQGYLKTDSPTQIQLNHKNIFYT